MPRKRRRGEKETISWRDFELLTFVCRYGVVTRDAMRTWAGTGRSVSLDRERRLREAGLIEVHPSIAHTGPLVAITRKGIRFCDRDELGPARLSIWSASHSAAVSRVAARLEAAGDQLLSEREIAAEERQLGNREYSAGRQGGRRGYHRPDLFRIGPESEDVFEVELTNKAPERLRAILGDWQAHKIETGWPDRIIYLCPPKTLAHVLRAIEKTGAGWTVEALELPATPSLRPTGQASGGSGAGVKGLRPDPLRGLTAAPPPLRSRVGRGGHPVADQ